MALKGIKVLELAGLAPGPYCGMLLTDFGARVTIIDKISNRVPIKSLEEGKQKLALDLKNLKGQEVLRKLCRFSDVLIDPYRPGVLERLNLSPDKLLSDNPRLIVARITGFGQNGPLAQKAGHDINYVALSGMLSYLGRKQEKPTPPINLLADFAGGGLLCAFGIVAALFERHTSNMGQIIDASMTEGVGYLGNWLIRSKDQLKWNKPRGENRLDGGHFYYDTYETKDGKYMSVGANEQKFYQNFLKGMGLRGIEQFEENENSVELVSKIFKTRTQREWTDHFSNLDACVFPVLDSETIDDHPQHIVRKSYIDKSLTDNIPIPAPAPRLSRTPAISGIVSQAKCSYSIDDLKEILFEAGLNHKDLSKLQEENILYFG